MTISSVASVASTLISTQATTGAESNDSASIEKQKQAAQQQITTEEQSKDDGQTKAQKLQEYNQALKTFEADLEELSKPSSASAPPKPTGPTSGLLDESV